MWYFVVEIGGMVLCATNSYGSSRDEMHENSVGLYQRYSRVLRCGWCRVHLLLLPRHLPLRLVTGVLLSLLRHGDRTKDVTETFRYD